MRIGKTVYLLEIFYILILVCIPFSWYLCIFTLLLAIHVDGIGSNVADYVNSLNKMAQFIASKSKGESTEKKSTENVSNDTPTKLTKEQEV